MTIPRRDFIRTAALAGGALSLGAKPGAAATALPQSRTLRILILGGTGFIGPHQVRYAQERGHTLTLFNRGRTAPELFPGIEQLRGDRATGELEALGGGREWDVVIDNSATNPNWVRDSAQLLADSAERYFFVSTRSVYRSWDQIPMTAEAEVNSWENNPEVDPNAERLPYGLSKALAEAAAHEAFPGRTAVFRPGLIIG
ncbi:MAG: NAD-dependent epimerase/dehydratase family protein, partial [Gemmatimonadetes bacterium]|nr:NAD-dependent epimerase/dehydratase family protein [Gemmatimonadota bacterium]